MAQNRQQDERRPETERTPGKAEGEAGAKPDAPLEAGPPGTPSPAEGERETAEAEDEDFGGHA